MISGKSVLKKAFKAGVKKAIITVGMFIVASAVGYLFIYFGYSDTNIVVFYLMAVLITVWLTRSFLSGVVSSLLATILFNYLFTDPYYAFAVNDRSYIIIFITMTATALITSTLTSHATLAAKAARAKEAETKAIYDLTNHLTDAENIHDIASIAVKTISACFSCNAACLCFDENDLPEPSFIQQVSSDRQIRREIANVREYKHKIEGMRTGLNKGEEFYDWPVYGREVTLGVVRIPQESARVMSDAQAGLLRSMIETTALAMDRFRSSEQQMKAREEIVKERYRANLLRAISHDLRTPLSCIIGTSEMLLHMTKPEDAQYSLAIDIHKEADWLYSMVENILNLTRLQDGRLELNKQMEAIEEIIGGAIGHIAKRSPGYEIHVKMPDELIMVPMDARLIEQVLVNLLDNAIKHSRPDGEICIAVEVEQSKKRLRLTVRDSGTGIAASALPHVFQMFYTSHQADTGHGIGLGLAICETIVKAHGGIIEARNREDNVGAEFMFTLPLEDENDESE